MVQRLNDVRRQGELRELFRRADAISRLEGYEPSEFEAELKERLVVGEIDFHEFLRLMITYVREAEMLN
ncbi:antitoxin VbhA family protein [Burkholderia multivorans]|uniref:antitoxin VbhA family protein n=1 Tax=Burkholderia multivorans TaxID=87883 RepID=UPI001C252087|nr:antitoxin VbhA family protein [Burkholderia multivorans]MBU9561563.1 antitoxin VbhA family protein [Burkholderia multivorans]